MDVVVKGRNVAVPEHFRVHVADKLQKMERYDNKLIEVNVTQSGAARDCDRQPG